MTTSVLSVHCALFCDHDTDVLSQQFNAAFVEHSPYVANGLEGLRTLVNDCPNMQYECFSRVRDAEWEVLLGCFTGLEEQPLFGFDLYRLDSQRRPIEHWDTLTTESLETPPPSQPDISISAEQSLVLVRQYFTQRQQNSTPLLFSEDPSLAYDRIHYTIAQGDLVFTLSEGHAEGQRYAIAELWRTNGNMLIGRWPAIVAIPTDEEAAHQHGLF